ncbi:MAG: hypothetical protein JNM39_11690 [Bdellovibrionaceae bacterium]|nr:hypothetical protein [Pseudobdellovibrionaceae bacterium]
MLLRIMIVVLLPLVLRAEQLRIVHFNIKELDSVKLGQGTKNSQVAAAVSVLRKLNPDFLSINEMQFDLPGIPSASFQSHGENSMGMMNLLSLGWPQISIGFGPSNTGTLAKKIPNTDNYTTNSLRRELADPVNFGVFPAEYSVAGATRFPVGARLFVQDLKWRDFRPDRDLSKFKDAAGNALDPNKIELFDKNFMDMVVKIEGRDVHFILLHTVPVHDFGKDGSPNSVRNADQLSFLEWYLTGKTDFVPPDSLPVKPLEPGALFVAMGDWNVDVRDKNLPGALVLQRLFDKTNLWMDPSQLDFTYESQSFYVPPYQDQLDYIITSKSTGLVIKKGGVYAPFARENRGCSLPEEPKSQGPEFVIVAYTDKQSKEKCFAEVSSEYAEIKTASDHRPVWLDLEVLPKNKE